MTMATRLQTCLTQHHSQYEVLRHKPSRSSPETARRAGIPLERLAKPVILDDARGHWLMAVVPASRQLDLHKLRNLTSENWRLARESNFSSNFSDCDIGAIPAVGSAFGMETVIDQSLMAAPDVYFEAGDHEGLVHMKTEQYLQLMPGARRGPVSE